jgi:kumamolisin
MRRRLVHLSWATLTPIVLCATLLAFALPSTTAVAVAARAVVAGAAPLPSNVTVVSTPINTSFDVSLKVQNAAALSTYIAGLTNPSSPDYRHFLTTSEFASRFGAASSSVDALRTYLSNYGLHVGSLSKGHVVLHVSGSTRAIARAFATSVVTVRRDDGQLAAQFRGAATLPAAMASNVAGIGGFSSVVEPSSNLLRAHLNTSAKLPAACPATTDSGSTNTPTALPYGGYNVAQQAQLYGLTTQWQAGHTGVGQTIAVYELGQYDASDVSIFDQCYGLTPTLSKISVDGGPGGGISDEATLDVEEAIALAPGANIVVYQGPQGQNGPLDVFQNIADTNTATIVSTSWGTCEDDQSNDPAAEVPIFEQMATQGQTVLSASGDEGSSDCYGVSGVSNQKQLAVDDPASQPLVTGVGGLTVSNLVGPDQSVWKSGSGSNAGSGGGGESVLWTRPTWQNAAGITSADTMRLVPDLSVMGDPITGFVMYYSGTASGVCTNHSSQCGWQPVGGTSIGAPLVSALVATAAQACGVARLGTINPTLYSMATTGFVDVTAGSNDLFGEGGYSAAVGYDMASGLGSPKPGTFFTGLCPSAATAANSGVSPAALRAATGPTGASLSATVRTSANIVVPNASLVVNADGTSGAVTVDGDPASATTSGSATYNVTTNATGVADFTVASTTPQVVTITVTYQDTTVGTSTITFAAPAKPGRASIAKLSTLVGGFTLRVRAPANDGGSVITRYQYSTDAGERWVTLARGVRATTVRRLAKGHKYVVVVRAVNVAGPGPASPRRTIRTKI